MDSETKRIVIVGTITLLTVLVVIAFVLSMGSGNPTATGAAIAEGTGVCTSLCPSCP